MALGLYVHIPFCSAICNYCNFNRGLFDAALKTRYVRALTAEIAAAADASPADTIFFGGGTPSLLEPEEVGAIIDACRRAFTVEPNAEVTLEANPETVTEPRLAAYREAGINRVSFGVQSFSDDELRRLSRLHSADRAARAVAEARDASIDNVSLDLMMWLPEQSVASWLQSIERLVELQPDHASLYLLELYPNAPLKEDMARAHWSLAPDEDAAEMYLQGLQLLDRAGYEQYEISNVSRGRPSRHNLKYWSDGEWLGFGCGAHSTRAGTRWKNRSVTGEYIDAVDGRGGELVSERRVLSRQERFEEAMFTGLRLTAGVDVQEIGARYDIAVWERYGEALAPFREAGLLIYDGARLRLTRQGMLLANEVMAVFIESNVR